MQASIGRLPPMQTDVFLGVKQTYIYLNTIRSEFHIHVRQS